MELTEKLDGVRPSRDRCRLYHHLRRCQARRCFLEKKWDGVLEPIFKAQLPKDRSRRYPTPAAVS
ncbi:MAG: hypothetical protein ACLSG5_04930 [Oscillospiraceae bacterium]